VDAKAEELRQQRLNSIFNYTQMLKQRVLAAGRRQQPDARPDQLLVVTLTITVDVFNSFFGQHLEMMDRLYLDLSCCLFVQNNFFICT
jgi:hypothetical protein